MKTTKAVSGWDFKLRITLRILAGLEDEGIELKD